MKNLILLCLVFNVVFGLVGCTRKNEEVTKVTLFLPKMSALRSATAVQSKSKARAQSAVQAQSGDWADHTIVNVKASDLGPGILCHYEKKRNKTEGPCDFSTFPNVAVTVPMSGDKARLFQIGMVNEAANGIELFYGENFKLVNAANVSVDITVGAANMGGGGVGHMRGQLLIGSTGGPTGRMEVRLRPQTATMQASDSITLMRSEVFNGWFQAVSFESLPLEYHLNGMLMFGKPVSKADIVAMAAQSPAAIKITSGQGGYDILGYFGTAADVGSKFTNNDAACTSAMEFTQCLKSSSDFNGPFRRGSAGSMFSMDQATEVGNWQFVPGTSSTIDAVKFYFLQTTTQTLVDRIRLSYGEYDCDYLEANPDIASVVGTVPTSATSISLAALNVSQQSLLVACPLRGGKHLVTGLTYPSIDDGGGGGGGCNDCKYLRIEINNAASRVEGNNNYVYVLTKDQCYPVTLKLFQGQGGQYMAQGDVTIANLASTAAGSFFSDAACNTTAMPSTQNFLISTGFSGTPNNTLFFKPFALNQNQQFPALTISSTSQADVGISFQPEYNKFDVAMPMLKAEGPSNIALNICYPIEIRRKRAAGDNINFAADLAGAPALNFNYSARNAADTAGIGDFYTDPNCASASIGSSGSRAGANGFASGEIFKTLYFKLTASEPTVRIRFTATDYADGSLIMTKKSGGPIGEKIRFEVLGNPIVAGMCLPARAILENYDGAEVPASSPKSIDVQLSPASSGVLYADGGCSGLLNSLMFGIGQSRVYFSVQFFAASTLFSFSVPSGIVVPVDGGQVSVVANPTGDQVDYIYLQLPDFNKKEVIGTHEFTDLGGTAKLIPIIAPPGSTFQCSEDESTWGDCGTNVQGSSFVWTKTRATAVAAADRDFYIRRVSPYGSSNRIRFRPDSYWGLNFKVLNCDYVQATNTTFADLVSKFDTPTNAIAICINPGVTVTKAAAQVYELKSAQKIIGSVAETSVMDLASLAGGTFVVRTLSDSVGPYYVANLKFTNVAGSSFNVNSADTAVIDAGGIVPASPLDVIVSGNEFNLSKWAAGVRVINHSAPNVSIVIRENKFNLTNSYDGTSLYAGGVGVWIKGQTSTNRVVFENNTALGLGNTNTADASVGIWQMAQTGVSYGTNIKGFKATGNLYGGRVEADSPHSIQGIEVKNSRFKLENGLAGSFNVGLKFDRVDNFTIQGNRFEGTATGNYWSLVRFGNLIPAGMGGQFIENVLEHNKSGPLSSLNNLFVLGGSGSKLTAFRDNHFVNLANPIDLNLMPFGSAGDQWLAVGPSTPSHGNNVFCTNVASMYNNVTLPSMVNTNSNSDKWLQAVATSKCMKANDGLVPGGMCRTPCSP